MYSVVCGFRKKLMILVSICLILSIIISVNGEEINFSSLLTNHQDSYQLSSLAPHSAILIEYDDNFTDYGFSGNGSEVNPFIIEDYNISISNGNCIKIKSTTKFFIIRNCFTDGPLLGIGIENLAPGTASIINNTLIIGHAHGIQIQSTNNVTISNNTCIGKYRDAGVNTGITLYKSENCIISNNTAYNKGIRLWEGFNSIVRNNSMYNCGISYNRPSYAECTSYTIENNRVNDKPLGYFIDENSLNIQSSPYGQLILINCDYSNIQNQVISNSFDGISLFYSRESSISNNTCINNTGSGIYLFESSSNEVQNNTCDNNLENGLFIHFSFECIILDNNLAYNGKLGIILGSASNTQINDNHCINNSWIGIGGFYADSATVENNLCIGSEIAGIDLDISPNSIIKNNTCRLNDYHGIWIRASDNTEISLNEVYDTEGEGIHFQYSSNIHVFNNSCYQNEYGIRSWGVENCIIEANLLSNNSKYGIKFHDSSSCVLTYNHIENNTEYGIYLTDCSGFTIHHNNFVNNNESTSQAYDNGGVSNIWYDTYTDEGNFWTDYLGTGSYFIDGDSSSFDLYPLESQSIPQLNEFRIISIIPFISLSAIVILLVRKKKKTC
ncbi:MAG: right-handed parallel beta-helix repeat-containing protein [Candidatus Heimdallarchaeota archaeon]|nr:right-handed parallel beta-helix repeat-containing protein [Candidatus Heimdallarchaeota archaeon]MCK5144212.1 right-handed parallel beta-helix repeat-containing protein [Candidatus Heimdallarchaeota archaeon]